MSDYRYEMVSGDLPFYENRYILEVAETSIPLGVFICSASGLQSALETRLPDVLKAEGLPLDTKVRISRNVFTIQLYKVEEKGGEK